MLEEISAVLFMEVRPLWLGELYLLSEKFHFCGQKNNLLNSGGTMENQSLGNRAQNQKEHDSISWLYI